MRHSFIIAGILMGCFCVVTWVLSDYHPLQDSYPVSYQESLPPHQGLSVYVINLDDNPQRWAYVFPQVKALNYPVHRISGVHGRSLSPEFIQKYVDDSAHKQFFQGKILGRGAIGCSFSHIKAWVTFLASPYAYGLICEDDIGFDPNVFKTVLQEVLSTVTAWDICAFALGREGGPLCLMTMPSQHKLCLYLRTVFCASCYMINRPAARRLLQKALPLKMPIDYFYTSAFDLSLIFTGIEPRPVDVSYGRGNSEINRIAREHQAEPPTFYYWLSKHLFSLRTGLARFFYALKQYISYKIS